MQSIPDTFCPAKWDELYVSFETNYAYSCCKSTPTVFGEQVLEFVTKERMNMLRGIQDASCSYCWTVEHAGGESLRHRHLRTFDPADFEHYQHNPAPKQIQVTVGNECNFQCTYCNPKFSSRWEQDVRQQSYRVFSDRYFWDVDRKEQNVMEKNIAFLKSFEHVERLSIIGGEPLVNKRTFELIDAVSADVLQMITNLSCKKSVLDALFERSQQYRTVVLVVSIDATGSIAEFARHGLDFDWFDDNFRYLLANRPANLKVVVNSLMTSITVRDFDKFSTYMQEFLTVPNFEWRVEYCKHPVTQSMATLPDRYKDKILVAIEAMKSYNIWGLDTLATVVSNTSFNKNMHQQMTHFMHEFAKRKKIEIPLCLD
jgi:hypothetical protein